MGTTIDPCPYCHEAGGWHDQRCPLLNRLPDADELAGKLRVDELAWLQNDEDD